MTGNVSLLLVYEPAGGRPLTVARVSDSRMLVDAAQFAIVAAEQRAEELAAADGVLGEVERAEAGRLRKVLSLLVPELRIRESAYAAGPM
jgi:hypothetical protein